MVDGKVRLMCTLPFKNVAGKEVKTLEGFADEDRAILAESFNQCGGTQCGYCTPGQIMSAVGLIAEGRAGEDLERIREGMSGNICRCAAYHGITLAVRDATRDSAGGRKDDAA